MPPLLFQSPKAAILAVAFGTLSVHYLYNVYFYVSVGLDDKTTLCGAESNWNLSLENDCFRAGFLWPILLLSVGVVSALSFCLCLVLPTNSNNEFTSDGSSPFARISIGNMLVAVRRPPGQTIVVDNRRRIGICTVILLAVETALYYAWKLSSPVYEVNGLKDYQYSSAMTQLSATVLLLASVCLVSLWRSSRMTYAGLFPLVLPAAVSIQLISGLCEVYYSFFTDKNANVPIIGADASSRSYFLVFTTFFNVVLMFLFSLVQWRPILYHPLDDSQSSSLAVPYTPLAEAGNNDLDDDYTPLAHMSDPKINNLIDSPEQNSSWFDKLSFSWFNEMFKRGARSTINYSHLYSLRPIDMPIVNWSRYIKQRKPGRPLWITLLMAYTPELLLQFVLTMVLCGLEFSNPFFLQCILYSIEQSQQGSSENNSRVKYLYMVGLLFFTVVRSVVHNQTRWIGVRFSIWLQGLLVAELTTKALRRRAKGLSIEKKENGNNDSAATDGKVMNILTADFAKCAAVSSYLDNIYILPFKLLIGIFYMYNLLGISALVGLIITALYIPLSKALFVRYRKVLSLKSAASDRRIAAITEVFQGIKAVKLFGWETRFLDKIDERREEQLAHAWKEFIWSTCTSVSGYLNPIIILVIMFTSYVVAFGNTLDAETAFTSIVVFQMVRTVMHGIPKYLNDLIGAYVSTTRIDSYLDQPQIQDLENRTNIDVMGDKLGFNSADLEWISPDSTNSTSVPTITGSDIDNQTAERTPLITQTSTNTQTAMHARHPVSQIPNQRNIERFSLKDIDVMFPLGQLSIVAGPTGSGKSSLLSALVGEMTLVRGSIMLPTINPSTLAANFPKYTDVIKLSNEGLAIHGIAYVAQEAWLRNATIRENILFGEPYDKKRYEEALYACALKQDLRNLVAGDMSEVGERGITLSGGQKQRLALARAVYSRCRILLIDDCLSAVDAQTANHILVHCLAGNSKLLQGRTCVLVTHHVAMCLPYAQYIVVMNEGRITLKGKPSGEKERIALSLSLDESTDNHKQTTVKSDEKERKAYKVYDKKSEDEYNMSYLKELAIKRRIDPSADLSVLQGILVKEEQREKGHVKLDVWKTFIQACGGKKFWIYLILVLVAGEAIEALRSYWIKLWVAASANSNNRTGYGTGMMISSQHHSSVYWLGIFTLFGLLSVTWSVLQWYLMFTGRMRMVRKMHRDLIRRVVHAVPSFFVSTPIGRIINCFSRDMSVIDDKALELIGSWLGEIVGVLTVYFVITAAIPAFIIVAVFTTGIFVLIGFYYLNAFRELKRLESNSMSPLLSLFGEMIQGATTIRAFGIKHYYIKEAINRITAYNQPFYGVWTANRWLHLYVNVVSAAIASTATAFIYSNLDWIDAGMAGFILSYAIVFCDDMLWVVRNYSDNETNMNAIERIMQYMNVEQEAALDTEPEHKPLASWPTKGDVQIDNLFAEYVPGVPVLHGVSLSIEHGEKVGIVGRTGSGKTTISLALLRFVEARKGRIILDGVDISKIGLEDLRRNVTIIPQDPVLFNGSIRFNLDPFDEHPDSFLWEALRRTHLIKDEDSSSSNTETDGSGTNNSALDIKRMAGIFTSLDNEIKENGHNLSAGQRQLVALARALVRRSRLIVMDEATASVDFDTDSRIQTTIRGPEFANSTLLCIAHRLRTIIDYDRVLVLDDGRVAEFDTPHNLLQKEGGIFKRLCEESSEYEHMKDAAAASRN